MNLSVYEQSIPQFMNELNALKGILAKTKAWSEAKKMDVNVFWGMRLAPDMFPLGKQIQIVCDGAKAFAGRLTSKPAPVFEDKEQTYEEFIARINNTMSYLETIKPEDFAGYENKNIEFPWYPGMYLMGKDYVIQHAIPNFYFHLTTTYAILRSNGVDLGKMDFLGQQNWKKK